MYLRDETTGEYRPVGQTGPSLSQIQPAARAPPPTAPMAEMAHADDYYVRDEITGHYRPINQPDPVTTIQQSLNFPLKICAVEKSIDYWCL